MTAPHGIIAAFLTLFCWTAGTLYYTQASRLYHPVAINRVRLLYALVLLSIIMCLVTGVTPLTLFENSLPEHWLWLGISGIVGLSIGDAFTFHAYKIMGSSRTSLFNTFAPGAALIGGYFMLGERISIIGLAGMAVSVSGIIWFIRINGKQEEQAVDISALGKGLLLATLGAICQGMGLVFAKKGLLLDTGSGAITPIHATWIRMLVATAAIYIAGVFKTDLIAEFKAVTLDKRVFRPTLAGTLLGAVMGISFSLYAAATIEVSLAQTIFSLQPVSVFLAVYLLGKEKLDPASIIAALIGVAGVFILAWRNELAGILQRLIYDLRF